jgi:F420 biosynthesis protein FbiB-like protein
MGTKMAKIGQEIKKRRSIRRYTARPVAMNAIRSILETASYAPSAHNAQPWRFIVITNTVQKAALADAMAKTWLQELEKENVPKNTRLANVKASVKRFSTAPLLILACLSMQNMHTYPDSVRQAHERDLAVQSLAAAIQNLLLSAYFEGLSACWHCAPMFCKETVRKVLEIPEQIEPQALITVGYPAEAPKAPKRVLPEDFAFMNKWGERVTF